MNTPLSWLLFTSLYVPHQTSDISVVAVIHLNGATKRHSDINTTQKGCSIEDQVCLDIAPCKHVLIRIRNEVWFSFPEDPCVEFVIHLMYQVWLWTRYTYVFIFTTPAIRDSTIKGMKLHDTNSQTVNWNLLHISHK
jgi:hypothetical protein